MTHPVTKALKNAPTSGALASYLGISKQTMTAMTTKARTIKGYRTPSKHALKIAQVAGLPPHSVRPDLYVRDWKVEPVTIGSDGKVKRPSRAKPKPEATAPQAA